MSFSIDCNSLPERLREICDGTARKANGSFFSMKERKLIMGKRLQLDAINITLAPVVAPPKTPEIISQIGDFLHQIIIDQTGNDVPCSECKKEIVRLNSMTPSEVRECSFSLAQRITERSRSNAQRWYQRLVATILPEFVASKVRGWIEDACLAEELRRIQHAPSLRWSYGITTVIPRSDDLFPRTLESLIKAGFDSPRLFVDGCTPSKADFIYGQYDLPLTIRDNVRTAGNWVLALYELWIRDTTSDRYAIFQDDFVTVRNLKRYLELAPYPSDGYQNLYTFPVNQKLAPPNYEGWYLSDQNGKGAVALVFSNTAVRRLLGQSYLVDRFESKERGHKAIDGGIVEAMKSVGWSEYVHTPSLVQHTGAISSMGNKPHQLSTSFPGESFDALSLLHKG